MNYIKGKNMKLYYNNVVIGCATDCEISIGMTALKILPKLTWRWDEFVEGRRTWSAKTSGYVAALVGFEPVGFFSKEKGALNFACTVGDRTYTGKCIVTSAKISSTTKGLVKYELGIQGSGELTSSNKAIYIAEENLGSVTSDMTTAVLVWEYVLNKTSGKVVLRDCRNRRPYATWVEDPKGRYDSGTNINSSKYIVFTSEGIYKWSEQQGKFVKQ